jgi:nitrate/TMAO reductase-like tetraheme cytochrome c subunit
MSRFSKWLLVCLACVPFVGAFLWFVYHTKVLIGVVADDNGPVAGAQVQVPGTDRIQTTGSSGRFLFWKSEPEFVVTAWKDGYYIGQLKSDAKSRRIELHRLPSEDFEEDERKVVAGHGRLGCSSCHKSITDEMEFGAHGRTGGTFNLFYGGIAPKKSAQSWTLLDERPEGSEVCASCHAPIKSNWQDMSYAAPKLDPPVQLHGAIGCSFCHSVVGAARGEVGIAHGVYGLEFLRPKDRDVVFGPHKDAAREDTAYSPFQKQSRLCASCHEGVVFGVRVYETYSEWQESPAAKEGKQCQDCHMKPTGKMTNMAPGHGGVERDPNTLANHRFFDGSQQDMLKACLNLDLSVNRDADRIRARIEIVANGVGHRVPTGLPDRNLALVVEAFDADGNPVPAMNGATLPNLVGPELKGKSGMLFAKVLKDWEGNSPVPFWRAAPEFDDSRLTPGQTERLEFAFPPSAVSIRARLIYRKFWPEVIKQKGWLDTASVVADKTQIVK